MLNIKNKLFSILFFLVCVNSILFANKKKDYANYKDWQLSIKKSEAVSEWEKLELNYSDYTVEEYSQKIQELIGILKAEENSRTTLEYETSLTESIEEIIKLLTELKQEAILNNNENLTPIRSKTNLAFLDYTILQENIVSNSINEVFNLLIWLFIILFLFVGTTAFFAIRFAKSHKNEHNISVFNKQILEAQENERKRLSLELHDTIAQDLRALQLLSSKAFSMNKQDNELLQVQNQILEMESKSILEIRTMCYNLTPPDLDRKDLRSALTHYCSTYKRDTGIECSLVITEDCDFSSFTPENQLNIFRLVQESLTNAAKHSKAEETTIIFRVKKSGDKNILLILITDDGIGFNLESSKFLDSHFGLRGMKERTNYLKGNLSINTAPDEGTEVHIEIPIPEGEIND